MVKTQNYKEKAYLYIKDQIDNNVLLPDTHLKEIELSETLNMSRTPIRKAMAQLEKEGYIRIEPYRGATVAKTDLNSKAIVERLQFIEFLSNNLFKQMQNRDIEIDATELNKRMRDVLEASDREDMEQYYNAESEFFRFLISYHSNGYFRQITMKTVMIIHNLYHKEFEKSPSGFYKERQSTKAIYEALYKTLTERDYPNAHKQIRLWINQLILKQINN